MQDQHLEWLKPQMDMLFDAKLALEKRGKDINASIQGGKEYRNPRIGERLIERYDIKEYGTNLPQDYFDPDRWSSRSAAKAKMSERSERSSAQGKHSYTARKR